MELEGESRVSKNGNQMTVCYMDCERYIFDFNLCKSDDGWLTVETKEDASYFGVWVHPGRLETVQFIEGDVYHTVCDTPDAYAQEIDSLIESYGISPAFVSIDDQGVTEHYTPHDQYMPKP